ncbi:MAG TPA: hypothetical protein VLA09_10560, partial [Longimicrobiales bacterium]|nr:hypothetical protein [Longimicrobiales bacterium]
VDPQSRENVLSAIQALARGGTTILYTTHYMEEAERLCDRVGIMDRGRLIALGSPTELIRSLGAEHVLEFTLEGGAERAASLWEGLPSVRSVRSDGSRVILTAEHAHYAVPALMRALERERLELSELTTHHATLEDVFLSLTGRHLLDD